MIVAGGVLRGLVLFAWRPSFLGYADSSVYLEAAHGRFDNPAIPDSVFFDNLRPAGYPIFLRLVHAVSHDLTVAMAVQHLLGIASAVLLYLAVRRIGGAPWLGLVPAGIVLFGGLEVFVENAALTEPLYIFLTAGGLYAAVRALDSLDAGWAGLAGFMFGAGACVRFVGIAVLPIVAVWLMVARRDTLRGRLMHTAALLAWGAVLIGGYVYAQHQATGYTGLTRSGGWVLYGRVAAFADCSKFTPPPGTGALCESTPPSRRPGQNMYLFNSYSPAIKAFGFPDWGGDRLSSLSDDAKVAAFTRAAILGQPLAYLGTVARDSIRYVLPWHAEHDEAGLSDTQLVQSLQDPAYLSFVMDGVLPGYFDASGYTVHHGLLGGLESYERHTRIEGPLFCVLLLLALAGPFAARGRIRAGSTLFTLVGLELLVAPVATVSYDARLAIPSFGVLGAAAALGGYALWGRAREFGSAQSFGQSPAK